MDVHETAVEKFRRLILSPDLQIENFIVDVTADGKTLGVCCNQSVVIYDVLRLIKLHSFLCNAGVQDIKFSPDGDFLACMAYKNKVINVLLFQMHYQKLYMKLSGDENFSSLEYSKIFWSPKSSFLWFSSNFNLSVDIIKVDDQSKFLLKGNKIDSLCEPLCCFSPDEDYYISVQRTTPFSVIIYSTNKFICLKKYSFEDIKEVNGVSWFPDSASFCLWDSSTKFNFQARSLDGRLEKKLSSDLTNYGIKSVAHSPSGRLIAIMQIKKPGVELYDSITWKIAAVLIHNENSYNSKNERIIVLDKSKLETSFNGGSTSSFTWCKFTKDVKHLKADINLQTSELNYGKNKNCHLQFSFNNQFLATHIPEFPNWIWIWNFHSYELLDTIIKVKYSSEKKPSSPDIHWHPSKLYLAIDIGNEIIIWNQEMCSLYLLGHKSGSKVKSSWCNTKKLLITAFTSNQICLAFETV